jgi:DNA mismatch endonuclease (patch repair protein)
MAAENIQPKLAYCMKKYRPKDAAEIHRNMAAIRATENRTERALRSALHRLGLRYRKYAATLPGRPDIVFPSKRVAVFVDGDYWHARVLQEKGSRAFRATVKKRATRSYWLAKLRRNVARDRAATKALREAGWLVIRLWESDTKRDVVRSAKRIARAVRRRA